MKLTAPAALRAFIRSSSAEIGARVSEFSFSRIRSSRAVTVAVAGGVLATMATGVSLAATAGSDGYKACGNAQHRLALENSAGKCPHHFTRVSVGAQGPAGPAGTARDAGAVFPGAKPTFYPEGLKGWRAVTRAGVGLYCLVPDASSDDSNTSLLVSGGSPGAGGLGFVTWVGYCATPHHDHGRFSLEVATSNINGKLANGISFEAVIP